jgi:hypothetical protein
LGHAGRYAGHILEIIHPGISLSVDTNLVDQQKAVDPIWRSRSGRRAPEQRFSITPLAWAGLDANIVVRDP